MLPRKGSLTSLLLQWQSPPRASIFMEEKSTWSFLFEKNVLFSYCTRLSGEGQSSWCLRDS